MLDRLTVMQSATTSMRAPQSYANDWGNDIKVEIPETGISFSEAYRYLTSWLGDETHLGGEVVRTGSGITLTVRLSNADSATFTGPEANLNALIDLAAEHVYGHTQPFRYAFYLLLRGNLAEALARFKTLALSGSEQERPWGYNGWGDVLHSMGDLRAAEAAYEQAGALQRDNAIALVALADYNDRYRLDRPEQSLRYAKELQRAVAHGSQKLFTAYALKKGLPPYSDLDQALSTGDFSRAVQATIQTQATQFSQPNSLVILGQTLDHDLGAARAPHASVVPNPSYGHAQTELQYIEAAMLIDNETQNWAAVTSHSDDLSSLVRKYPPIRLWSLIQTGPLLAYAQARLGNFAAADAEIAKTPTNCDNCLRTRARIADLEGQHGRADYWYARAVKAAPDIPFAYADWGQALLARGQPDAAIAKLKVANEKGPHFADALEIWGEALMAKNRSDLALTKFAEANKYAPKWGRLHLKWGEALFYAGRKNEAKVQFAAAMRLELPAADKAELERMRSAHG
jgi:tetratricopeptide (TPR) repeat protein